MNREQRELELDDLTDIWHNVGRISESLQDYLGLSREDYNLWLHDVEAYLDKWESEQDDE